MKKVMISLAAMMFLSACMPNYSDGDRVGVVNKFSKKGLVFKSWEGELLMEGFKNRTDTNGNSRISANVLHFSTTDDKVAAKVQEAMDSESKIKLHYSEWLIAPLTIGSSHVVTDVKPVR
jgi:hypothetical protein